MTSSTQPARFGVIGIKGAGKGHLAAVQALAGEGRAQLAAICDIDESAARKAADAAGESSGGAKPTPYRNYQQMLSGERLDVVCIATPHYLHAPMTIAALQAGAHVLCEKPIAISVSEADQMIETAQRAGMRFAVGHQGRFSPSALAAKRLIGPEAETGELVRVAWLSGGIRTQAYYDSGDWRGTWSEEGGGTLINQKVHDLDRLCWYAGLPSEVMALTGNFHHQVEPGIETLATAVLRWDNGAQGVLQLSITDGATLARQEFHGQKAVLVIDGDHGTRLGRYARTIKEHVAGAGGRMEKLDVTWEDLPSGARERDARVSMYAHFLDWIDGSLAPDSPLCTGEAGRDALEVVNGVILSAFRQRPVSLPVDRADYDTLLEELKDRAIRG
ncbi:MAG TPA: Gfo/Idh/MocA family oxidoreductase [Chloroflexota bacterium]|nr:Gfo/Idh/MocA family oxidoreductase [Chloroflexota bacterium]